jgi:hypothetical protein
MPQNPLLTFGKSPTGTAVALSLDASGALTVASFLSANIVGANAGVLVKTGAGSFRLLTINTPGTSSTLVVYDGTSTAGTKLGTFATTTQNSFGLNLRVSVGLFVVTTGTGSDITIGYS